MNAQRPGPLRFVLSHGFLFASIALVVFSMVMLTTVTGAQGTESAIVVNTFDDELEDGGGDCSLREAIEAANSDQPVDGCTAGSGDDAIVLPAGAYALGLAGTDEDANHTGDLDILAGTLILIGPGPERTRIDGGGLDRVLHVHEGADVEVHGVEITGGRTPDGYGPFDKRGGGILNEGSLLLADSVVSGNRTGEGSGEYDDGGDGGGIYNAGELRLKTTSIVDNVTGAGDGAFGFGEGGNGGSGGGIYNIGSLILHSSTLTGNSTGDGGPGGGAGDGGLGGGVSNSGALQVADSTIGNNRTGDGGNGWWGGGRGGLGGGIYSSGTLTVSNTTVTSNVCGAGGGGPAGYGGFGGSGGGIHNDGTATITLSAVVENQAGQGGGGDYGMSGGGGGGISNRGHLLLANSTVRGNVAGEGGYGGWGAIMNAGGAGGGLDNSGVMWVTRSTLAGNTSGQGGRDPRGEGNDGGSGGGISSSGVLTLTDCTLSQNRTGDGGEGEEGHAGPGGGLSNGGIVVLENCTVSDNTAGTLTIDGIGGGIVAWQSVDIRNTILAGNRDVTGANDCEQVDSPIDSSGYNLVEAAGSCVFTATGDVVGVPALLAPLGDYGGDTHTHALAPGSPAIDRGSCPGSGPDQRGFPRPVDLRGVENADDGCDVGAYEFPYSIYLPLAIR